MKKTNENAKWLRGMFYISIVSLVKSAMGFLPISFGGTGDWISRGIMLVMVVCLLKLTPLNARYRKAGIFRAGMLACALFTALLFGSLLLTLAASVFSILSVYQEYRAHEEVTAEMNPALSRSWGKLFYWQIAAAILLSLASTVTAVVLSLSQRVGEVGGISALVITLFNIPQLVFSVFYLVNLKKTIDIVSLGREEGA